MALVLASVSGSAGAATSPEGMKNDTIATALDIIELPYAHTTATDQAVDNTDDDGGCFDGDSGYSVWYRYTPQTDTAVRFATAGSEFDTVLDVFAGEQRELVACNDDSGWDLDSTVAINATAGETYLIRAAGLGDDRGLLEFSAQEAIPMEAALEIGEQAIVRPAKRRVVLNGVLECNQDGFAFVQFVATQGVGPLAVSGQQGRFIPCGEEVPFTVRIRARRGAFLPGPVDVEWFGSACVGGGGGVIIVDEGSGTEPGTAPGSGGSGDTADHEEDPSCASLEGTQSVIALPALPN